MPIEPDNWNRKISTELEELQDYLSNLSSQLRLAVRIPLNMSGRNEFQVIANDRITGLYTPWFSKNKSTGAMLAIKIDGGSPVYFGAPAFSNVNLGPSGLLIFDPAIAESGKLRVRSCETGQAVKPNAAILQFLASCLKPERGPIITGIQLPHEDNYGLLSFMESNDEDGRPLHEEQVLIYKDSGNNWEVIRSKILPMPEYIRHTYHLCINRLVRYPQHWEPEIWIEYLNQNSFITRGTIDRKFSCQLSSEYSGDLPREVVAGVDTEYVYILDRSTGVLQRIPVK